MATKQQAYDHPAYMIPTYFNFGVGTSPSTTATPRLSVANSLIAKAAQLTVSITGTNTSTIALLRLNGTNTTTTTLASMIIGTGVVLGTSIGTGVGATGNFLCGTTTLNQGDQVWAVSGVDVSVGFSLAVECYVVPGANLTV
jgi:hypothetical protein